MLIYLRNGDTLWYYSQLFSIPLQLIIDSNPGIQPNNLRIGQPIQIPGYITKDYQIAAGDSFWKIAAANQLPLDMLFLPNPMVNVNQLQIGQRIKIPQRVVSLTVNISQPYTYSMMMRQLNELIEIFPFLRVQTIGSSVMGKNIPEIKIGIGDRRVHANGSFHANEWITTPVLMRFLNEYALALTLSTAIRGVQMDVLYLQSTLSLVPMVDPDGVDLVIQGAPETEPYHSDVIRINGGSQDFSGWKANIRGVDLNNQFPAFWEREAERGPKQPSPRDYSGTAPLTEPEAQAMAQLTRVSDFHRVLAFHTQGKVIYWGFMNLEPAESERLVQEFARVSGYEPIRTIDSYAGYKDWFIQDWRRPGFTVELGRGVNPLPLSQFAEIYQESLGILLAALIYL